MDQLKVSIAGGSGYAGGDLLCRDVLLARKNKVVVDFVGYQDQIVSGAKIA